MKNDIIGKDKQINYRKPVFILCIFALFVTFISWHSGVNGEDVVHFGCRSLDEAIYVASQSYQYTNPRIGEIFAYLIGVHENGAGTYNAIWFYRIAQPLFLVVGVLMLYRLGMGRWPDSSKPSTWCLSILCLLVACCKSGGWWLCGNLNWTYPFVVVLVFFWSIEPFFYGCFKLPLLRFLGAMVCIPVVGMSNENTSIVSFALVILVGCWWLYKNKKWCLKWQYVAILLSLAIFVYLFYSAPGRSNRASVSGWELSFENILYNSLLSFSNWFYVSTMYWRTVIVFCVLLLGTSFARSVWNARMGILLLAWLMLSAVLVCAPFWGGPRSFLSPEFIFYAVLVRLIYELACSARKNYFRCYVALQCCLSFTILVPLIVYGVDTYRAWAKLEKCVEIRDGGADIATLVDFKVSSLWTLDRDSIPTSLIEPLHVDLPLVSCKSANPEDVGCYVWGAFRQMDLNL